MDYYEQDKWKDFVLKVLQERGGSTLTDFVWNRLISEFNIKDDNVAYSRYKNCILQCLENEFKLIRTSESRGIHITEKGKQVAEKGYRSYMNSLKRHERLRRLNDYIGVITAILTILSMIFSFANMLFEWVNIWKVCIQTGILVAFFIIIKLLGKLN